jgi:hypothetical protein
MHDAEARLHGNIKLIGAFGTPRLWSASNWNAEGHACVCTCENYQRVTNGLLFIPPGIILAPPKSPEGPPTEDNEGGAREGAL